MYPYSFANSVVLVNGVELTGFADGDDVINVKRSVDSASHKVGASGQMMVSISTDKSGEIEFKLLQTSPSNAYLMDLCNRQEGGAETFVPINVLIQDTYRQDRASGAVGYIKKASDFVRGEKGNTHTWSIVIENLDMVLGTGGAAVPQ